MSFQGLWFVVAGFILGFATSTLWEWLYYRGKRRAQPIHSPPAGLPLVQAGERAEEASAEPKTEPAKPGWGLPYRSPGVYLENEQIVAAAPVTSAQAATPNLDLLSTDSALPRTPRTQPAFVPARRDKPSPPASPVQTTTMPPTVPPREATERQAAHTVTPLTNSSPELPSPQPSQLPHESTLPPGAVPPLATPGAHSEVTPAAQAPQPAMAPLAVPPPVTTPTLTDHPDDLALIKGIGEAYKRKLYQAGIYSWRQVAESETEMLRRITRAKPNANIEGWRQRARELAEQYQRWETTFQGPLDDLTRIEGIGAITAGILYKAGICTYEQLAGALPDELAQIVPAPTVGDEVDFEAWIQSAVRLANAKRRNQGIFV
ncbi:MAG: hypothetical protein KF832_24675 [Caldilineaceae bacterium]|nr:hypothetical protein [Caldilineaceae bacterium]